MKSRRMAVMVALGLVAIAGRLLAAESKQTAVEAEYEALLRSGMEVALVTQKDNSKALRVLAESRVRAEMRKFAALSAAEQSNKLARVRQVRDLATTNSVNVQKLKQSWQGLKQKLPNKQKLKSALDSAAGAALESLLNSKTK